MESYKNNLSLMSNINLNLVNFYICQQEYYRILNDYLYAYRIQGWTGDTAAESAFQARKHEY